MMRKLGRSAPILLLGTVLTNPALAQTPAPTGAATTPTYQPAAGAIVSGLSGLVTGANPSLGTDRATDRMLAFRLQLTISLLSASPSGKFSFGTLTDDHKDYVLSNGAILCDVRGTHAVVAADATYITTVTGTLNKFATAPQITTISQALKSVFQNYTINIPSGATKSDAANSVKQACLSDIDNWPAAVYGKPINDNKTLATTSAFLIGDDISAVLTLYQAIVSLVTPLVTTPATVLDAQRRATAITAFLKSYKTTLLNDAQELASMATNSGNATRLQALGQFAEKMVAVRAVTIDLSRTPACQSGLQNPILRTDQVKDSKGNVTGTYYIPTDAFVLCYSAAWQQMLDAVNAAVTAATQYDALADTSSDQLQQAVTTIKNNLNKLNQPATVDISDLSNAAALLITYGTAVSQALSSANVTKVQTDLNNVLKLFGGK